MATASQIVAIRAREVLDSRGRPTLEAEVTLAGGATGWASVPAGASRGRYEAHELRDGEPHRYRGWGVRRAVQNVERVLAPALLGRCALEQQAIDEALCQLDGTPQKANLGANALLAVSLAVCRAAAGARGGHLVGHLRSLYLEHDPKPPPEAVPLPMVNVISGGAHAGRRLDVQDFLIVPIGAGSYADAMAMVAAVYAATAEVLTERGQPPALVADEGGYGPALATNEEALALLCQAIVRAGFSPGREVAVAIDVAATQLGSGGVYRLTAEGAPPMPAPAWIDWLGGWIERYPVLSIEDPLGEEDWPGWRQFTARFGERLQIIGDDLFTTHPQRLAHGAQAGCANAVLVKLNQIGTLSETLHVVAQARRLGYNVVISARSGETEDPFIADLAVAIGAGQIKIGSITRSERLAKYNQLFRLAERWPFAGAGSFTRWLRGETRA